MCPKKFLTKKDFCPEKFFVQKYFESKKIVSPKKKLLKHFFFLQSFVLHQKTFGSKKLLGPKTNLVQKKSLVQNKFWYQKFLGPKNFYLKMICGQFWVKKNSGLLGIRVKWGGWGYLYLIIQLLDISEAYIPNLSPLVCLEPFKKFSVGGWVGGGGYHSEYSVLLWAKTWPEDWSFGPSWTIGCLSVDMFSLFYSVAVTYYTL